MKLSSNRIFTTVLSVVITIFAVGMIVSAAPWADPTVAPPGENTAEPINVSDVGQVKIGGLLLHTGPVDAAHPNGLIVQNGNVGIGTTTPNLSKGINGNIDVNDAYIRSVSKWASELGGGGSYSCPTGQVMTGVVNGVAQCVPGPGGSYSCPTGQFMTGVVNGVAQCAPGVGGGTCSPAVGAVAVASRSSVGGTSYSPGVWCSGPTFSSATASVKNMGGGVFNVRVQYTFDGGTSCQPDSSYDSGWQVGESFTHAGLTAQKATCGVNLMSGATVLQSGSF